MQVAASLVQVISNNVLKVQGGGFSNWGDGYHFRYFHAVLDAYFWC